MQAHFDSASSVSLSSTHSNVSTESTDTSESSLTPPQPSMAPNHPACESTEGEEDFTMMNTYAQLCFLQGNAARALILAKQCFSTNQVSEGTNTAIDHEIDYREPPYWKSSSSLSSTSEADHCDAAALSGGGWSSSSINWNTGDVGNYTVWEPGEWSSFSVKNDLHFQDLVEHDKEDDASSFESYRSINSHYPVPHYEYIWSQTSWLLEDNSFIQDGLCLLNDSISSSRDSQLSSPVKVSCARYLLCPTSFRPLNRSEPCEALSSPFTHKKRIVTSATYAALLE